MEHKARGAKHYANKNQKYKPEKYKPATKSTKQRINHKQAAALESNWHKYESDDEEGTHLTDSTNFALLADAAITAGSHFQFKSDKTADFLGDTENSSNNADNLFKLNLEILDKSLSTVPFLIRCGIDEKYFTENERNTMNATAASNLMTYKSLYGPQLDNRKSQSSLLNKNKTDGYIEDLVNRVGEVLNEDSEGDSGNEIDGVHQQQSGCAKSREATSQSEDEDLEEWLDDILAN